MRLHVAIVLTFVVVGCQSPSASRHANACIAKSLEKRIGDEEARHIAFDDIDRTMRAAQSNGSDFAELEVLARHRKSLYSKIEAFLSRFRGGDQLWVYRTHVTADRRGGESGFALVRDGAVVEHITLMIYD
jgi:hypothetical protein